MVRQARVLADEAGANRDRMASLFDQGVIPRAQLDTAEASYKVALGRLQDAREEIHNREAIIAQRRSELDIARQQLTDTSISAPFDGAIQEKRASVGEFLAAGAPLATIVRMDPLRLRRDDFDGTGVEGAADLDHVCDGTPTAASRPAARRVAAMLPSTSPSADHGIRLARC